jgi:hypothetical protein
MRSPVPLVSSASSVMGNATIISWLSGDHDCDYLMTLMSRQPVLTPATAFLVHGNEAALRTVVLCAKICQLHVMTVPVLLPGKGRTFNITVMFAVLGDFRCTIDLDFKRVRVSWSICEIVGGSHTYRILTSSHDNIIKNSSPTLYLHPSQTYNIPRSKIITIYHIMCELMNPTLMIIHKTVQPPDPNFLFTCQSPLHSSYLRAT